MDIKTMTPKQEREEQKKVIELTKKYPHYTEPEHPDAVAFVMEHAEWVIENIYPEKKDELYTGEMLALVEQTTEKTKAAVEERVKNLKAQSLGGMTEERNTVPTAEK